MEALQNTMTVMMEAFNKRMTEFDAELHKAPGSSVGAAGLAAEFSEFRTCTVKALHNLHEQVTFLARAMDQMEMRSRRKILLLHGVAEETHEDTAQIITSLVRDRLQLCDFSASRIRRCHRLGKASSQKSRPILFKLNDMDTRSAVWFAKTKLKGSGVTMCEFLTKTRHELFMAAREKFGVTRCWTRDGAVFVLAADGSRRRIMAVSDLDRPTGSQQEAVQSVSAPVAKKTAAQTKVKRAVTSKK